MILTRHSYKLIAGALFIIALILCYTSVTNFWKGYHNLDLAHNMNKVAAQVNPYLCGTNVSMMSSDEMVDRTIQDGEITLSTSYLWGLRQILRGYEYAFFFGVVLACALLSFFWEKKEEKGKVYK